MLDSVIRKFYHFIILFFGYKKFYPQTLLDECKYVIRKNKMDDFINNDLNLSSSDESDNDNDNESDNESDN